MKNIILIVDDLYANRYLLEEIFDEYEVHSVSDGDQMREILKTIKPDVILMDVNLPDQDGYELTKELKIYPATKDIPVIFLTVHNTKSDVIHGFKAGGVDFVVKPFDEKDLKSRVEKIMKDKKIGEVIGDI
jgi:CheY-like chemotaxis protein